MAIKYRILPIGGGGGSTPTGTINITNNGENINVAQYATANVAVPASAVDVGTLTIEPITQNVDLFTQDVTGYRAIAFQVAVPQSGGPTIPDDWFVTFTALEDNTVIEFNQAVSGNMYYSTDGKYTFNQFTDPITLAHTGDKVYMYGVFPSGLSNYNTYSNLNVTSGKVEIAGDLTCLLALGGKVAVLPNYAFYALFMNNSKLYGNIDLSSVTELKTNTLMSTFYHTKISSVDLKNLTTTGSSSLNTAFAGSSIESLDLRSLPSLGSQGAAYMCQNCTSLTDVNLSSLESIAGISAMKQAFEGCTSLTSIDLSALKSVSNTTSSGNGCLDNTFTGCTSLNNVTIGLEVGPANPDMVFNNWMYNVASTGMFTGYSTANWTIDSPSGIPTGWTFVSAPAISVDLANKQISMTSALPNSTIYYTTDGSTPTTSSTVYTGTITVPSGVDYLQIKAIASDGTLTSSVSENAWSDYFYLEATAANTKVALQSSTVLGSPSIHTEYSNDNGATWQTGTTVSTLQIGDRVYYRRKDNFGVFSPYNGGTYNYGGIRITAGSAKAGGCISTLINYKAGPVPMNNFAFYKAFNANANLNSIADVKFDVIMGDNVYNTFDNAFAGTGIASVDLTAMSGSVNSANFANTFANCSNLSEVRIDLESRWSYLDSLFNDWLSNVAASGTLYNDSAINFTLNSASGVPTGWSEITPSFRITNEYAGTNTISFSPTDWGTPPSSITLDYSTNNGSTWSTWSSSNGDFSVNLAQGESVLLKGVNNGFCNIGNNGYWSFSGTEAHSVSGPISSLVIGRGVEGYTSTSYALANLFNGDSNLVSALDLKLNIRADYGSQNLYYGLFYNCTSLVDAPRIIYTGNVSGLSSAFSRCTSLVNPPKLVGSIGTSELNNAFAQCTSLVNPPDMEDVNSIATAGMFNTFNGCTSLTTGPNLRNVAYAGSDNTVFGYAFNNCTSLQSVTVPSVNSFDSSLYTDWLNNVASSGIVHIPSGLCVGSGSGCIPENSSSGIPSGWTYQTY